jgi:hypothetical protein
LVPWADPLWGAASGLGYLHGNQLQALPLLFALLFLLIEWLPAWLKNTLAIAGLLAWFAA